ncbi:MAG: hypothetical protein H6935_02010 [Thiobacillus sp.]|nr:hypothetical protein [Thiobacillus sp.]
MGFEHGSKGLMNIRPRRRPSLALTVFQAAGSPPALAPEKLGFDHHIFEQNKRQLQLPQRLFFLFDNYLEQFLGSLVLGSQAE